MDIQRDELLLREEARAAADAVTHPVQSRQAIDAIALSCSGDRVYLNMALRIPYFPMDYLGFFNERINGLKAHMFPVIWLVTVTITFFDIFSPQSGLMAGYFKPNLISLSFPYSKE